MCFCCGMMFTSVFVTTCMCVVLFFCLCASVSMHFVSFFFFFLEIVYLSKQKEIQSLCAHLGHLCS